MALQLLHLYQYQPVLSWMSLNHNKKSLLCLIRNNTHSLQTPSSLLRFWLIKKASISFGVASTKIKLLTTEGLSPLARDAFSTAVNGQSRIKQLEPRKCMTWRNHSTQRLLPAKTNGFWFSVISMLHTKKFSWHLFKFSWFCKNLSKNNKNS